MSLHPLLQQQFEDARTEGGPLDLRKLLHAISDAYAEWDEERKGVVRSMRLLADETSAFTREVRESAASQLQVILDHVKDAIITVDETGRIDTLNVTGERVFGYREQDLRGKKLDQLIPSLAHRPRIVETLEELAASAEDTQADLKPRDIVTREAIENAVAVIMAIGGSTNAVLHFLAIAHAAEVEWGIDDFERVRRKVPVLCDLKPSGRYLAIDLHRFDHGRLGQWVAIHDLGMCIEAKHLERGQNRRRVRACEWWHRQSTTR
jgi:PAS domain-containing protein